MVLKSKDAISVRKKKSQQENTQLYAKYTELCGKKQVPRHGQSMRNSCIIHEGRKHLNGVELSEEKEKRSLTVYRLINFLNSVK